MQPETLAKIVRRARQAAFDRPEDPDRCPRILDKVKARCPQFVQSEKLAKLEAEFQERKAKADKVGNWDIYHGRDRGFIASRKACDRLNAWEAKHLLPLRASERKAFRSRPDVIPYSALWLC
jgi:hypothetical protein